MLHQEHKQHSINKPIYLRTIRHNKKCLLWIGIDYSCLLKKKKNIYLWSEDLGWKLPLFSEQTAASTGTHRWLKYIHERQWETQTVILLLGFPRQQHPGSWFVSCILYWSIRSRLKTQVINLRIIKMNCNKGLNVEKKIPLYFQPPFPKYTTKAKYCSCKNQKEKILLLLSPCSIKHVLPLCTASIWQIGA